VQSIPAAIIFVDSFKRSDPSGQGQSWAVDYYPLRLCEVDHHDSLALINNRDSGLRVDFSLKLGSFIRYKEKPDSTQWNCLAEFDSLRNIQDFRPQYFVIDAFINDDLNGHTLFTPNDLEEEYVWENLVRVISRSHNMKESVFIRLSKPQLRHTGLRRVREYLELPAGNKSTPVEPYTEGFLTSYTVRPAKEYRVDITIFDSPYDTSTGLKQHSGIEMKASSDQVYVAQPFHSIVSGLIERSAILSFKRTTESLLTTIAFTITDTKDNTTTNNPVFHLYITPKWITTVCFLVFVIAGSLLLSFDWKLLKVVGSLALGAAAFIAYRRLPVASGKSGS
jgi:hypothetical protein